MTRYETLRGRMERVRREVRTDVAIGIAREILSAVDDACEHPRYDGRGLVVVDLSEIHERAERLGFGDMPAFRALGDS